VMVNIDLATMSAELEDTGPITAESARRIACDSSLTRVVTRGRSEVLDIGRKTSVVSAAMRRALIARDGGCAFPTCDRPHAWCDAHHVVHWADGGETKLSNLILLCRPHHRLAHLGFSVEMISGQVTFRRPDGTVIAPP